MPNTDKTKYFGEYEAEKSTDMEYLLIGFSPSSIPLKQRWRNNGLSADFIADYLQTFFVGKEKEGATRNNAPIPVKSKNAAKYIANELLENAMKFSDENSLQQTRISFHLYTDRLIFYVTNSITPERLHKFEHYIQTLLDNDPHELYLKQMEHNATEYREGHSGLGFLSMICDYSAKIAWKFETLEHEPHPTTLVTTMVRLDV